MSRSKGLPLVVYVAVSFTLQPYPRAAEDIPS